MTLKVNDRLHGFTVTRIRDIEEFEGQLIEMTHDRTGAGLIWAKSTEENQLFSVGFRTLPEDNTGVFHILEHSVLCGSENYPVKEPFVELLKTSMNTFLNAMTYSDKTLYPVSSRMEQDYLNLAEEMRKRAESLKEEGKKMLDEALLVSPNNYWLNFIKNKEK